MTRYLLLILMAAGKASRFGENKLKLEIEGKPMYRHVFDHLFRYHEANPARCEVIVVSQFDDILQETRRRGGTAIQNDRPDDGIARTIRLSLAGRPSHQNEAAVFFTADQPYLSYATLEAFLDRASTETKGLLSARSALGMGNPVSFDRRYYDELRALKQDEGGRLVAVAHPEDTAWFDAPAEEMRDIDRPGDVTPKA